MASDLLAISQSTAWGAGGGLLAGIFSFIEERRIPQSEHVTKDRLWLFGSLVICLFGSLVLLPSVAAFIAVLDHGKCSEIDAATSVLLALRLLVCCKNGGVTASTFRSRSNVLPPWSPFESRRQT